MSTDTNTAIATVSPYGAAKYLEETHGVAVRPQMMYNYVRNGTIPSTDKRIKTSDLDTWVEGYLARKVTSTREERVAVTEMLMTELRELGWAPRSGYGESIFSPTNRVSVAVTDDEGSFEVGLWRVRPNPRVPAGYSTEHTGSIALSNLTPMQFRHIVHGIPLHA